MLNVASFEGRLTKDPELKEIDSGKSVVNITVAVDRGFGKGEADFIPVVIWGKQAEAVAKFKKKGDMISVNGSLKSRSYPNNDGKLIYVLEVVANSYKGITFLGNARKVEDNTSIENITQDEPKPNNQFKSETAAEFYDDVVGLERPSTFNW